MKVPKPAKVLIELAWNRGRRSEYAAFDFYVSGFNCFLVFFGDRAILTRAFAVQCVLIIACRGADVIRDTWKREEHKLDH